MVNTGELLIVAIVTVAIFTLKDLGGLGDRVGYLLSCQFLQRK